MATLLLVVIYTAYIGLGIPDSLFGSAWPAIYEELGLPISYAGAVTTLTCLGTIASSLMSASLIRRLGTSILTALSTTLTALALLGFSFSGSFIFLCIFAVPLGLGAGAIDSAQNNYVALHYNATHMCFLHCFYGVGVSLSPYLMSVALEKSGWRKGYLLAFTVQAVISVICIIAIPLWKRAHPNSAPEALAEKPESVSLLRLARMPAVRATWLMFIFTCGIESICTIWGATFLVESKGFAPADAAKYAAIYFLGLATGRFVSGLLAKRLTSWQQIYIGCSVLLLAITALALPTKNQALVCAFLFLTGFGVGPLYPDLTYLTPIHFGRELSAAVIGSQMAMAYVGILILPIVFGCIADILTTDIFPFALLTLFALLMLSMLSLKRSLKKNKK